jgi:homopolymeric O-antigen transport system permease protein
MVVYTTVYTLLVRFQVPRYPVFLLSGLLPWNAFTISLTTASMTIVGNGNLIRRVSFPRELLPLSAVLASVVNLLLSFVVLLLFAVALGQPLGPPLLALPLLLLLQLALTAGVCLVAAALMVYFRDIEQVIGIAVTVLFFVTPVLYPLSALGHRDLRRWLELNPMAWLVGGYQSVWHGNAWPDPQPMLALAAAAALSLGLGLWVFRRLAGRFAEEV